jgi:hypothetical protein
LTIETAPDILAIENDSPMFRPETYDREEGSLAPQELYMAENWGKLSPFSPLDPGTFGLPKASHVAPDGCAISAVHILLRHGARYPSGHRPAFVKKIKKAKKNHTFNPTGQFVFLKPWAYGFRGSLRHDLTPFGRQELYFFITSRPCLPCVSFYHSSTGMNMV